MKLELSIMKHYNDGGLARVTREDTADKIQEGENIFVINEESCFFQAAKRRDISLSGSANDAFAASVLLVMYQSMYHQPCYIKFLYKPDKLPSKMIYKKTKQKMF